MVLDQNHSHPFSSKSQRIKLGMIESESHRVIENCSKSALGFFNCNLPLFVCYQCGLWLNERQIIAAEQSVFGMATPLRPSFGEDLISNDGTFGSAHLQILADSEPAPRHLRRSARTRLSLSHRFARSRQ
jgi:hypothetical protein